VIRDLAAAPHRARDRDVLVRPHLVQREDPNVVVILENHVIRRRARRVAEARPQLDARRIGTEPRDQDIAEIRVRLDASGELERIGESHPRREALVARSPYVTRHRHPIADRDIDFEDVDAVIGHHGHRRVAADAGRGRLEVRRRDVDDDARALPLGETRIRRNDARDLHAVAHRGRLEPAGVVQGVDQRLIGAQLIDAGSHDFARDLEAGKFMSADDFLKAANNAELIRDIAPHAETLEGFSVRARGEIHRLQHTAQPVGSGG